MWLVRVFAGLALVGLVGATAQAEVKPIDWDDLLPPSYLALEAEADAIHQKVEALPPEELEAFDEMDAQRRLRLRIEAGELSINDLQPHQQTLLEADYDPKFPRAVELVTSIESIVRRARGMDGMANDALDGKIVRMPGYVLPLELDGTETVEFLLVPYVGACIHVPPPPANQMVHVNFDPGFENQGLYTPVYVTGRLAAVAARVNFYLTDGNTTVETGYRLAATKIEPYEE